MKIYIYASYADKPVSHKISLMLQFKNVALDSTFHFISFLMLNAQFILYIQGPSLNCTRVRTYDPSHVTLL